MDMDLHISKAEVFMKNLNLLMLSILTLFSFNLASAAETFNFKYQFQGEVLTISQQGNDQNHALTIAAKSCFRHFKGNQKVNESKGLDIIDVCANPRKS